MKNIHDKYNIIGAQVLHDNYLITLKLKNLMQIFKMLLYIKVYNYYL